MPTKKPKPEPVTEDGGPESFETSPEACLEAVTDFIKQAPIVEVATLHRLMLLREQAAEGDSENPLQDAIAMAALFPAGTEDEEARVRELLEAMEAGGEPAGAA